MSIYSENAENMFDYFLNLAGYKNLASDYNKEDTLQLIGQQQLDFVQCERKKQDKDTKWHLISVAKIIDWCCHVDSIISPNGCDKWGFDVTLNPEKVTRKVNTLKQFSYLWKCLGISKMAVVLVVKPENFDGIIFLSDEQKEMIVDTLVEDIIYPMDEQSSEVRKYVFFL